MKPFTAPAACLGLLMLSSCGSPPGSAPGNLTAEPSVTSQVTLRWQPVEGAEAYRVYRLWGGFVPNLVGKTGPETFYQDSQLDDGATYQYRVTAVSGGREGPPSASAKVTTHPGQVKGITASVDGTAVRLRWKPLAGVAGYRVFRETEGALAAPADFPVEGAATDQFVDPAPPAGLTHRYFVLVETTAVAYSYGGASSAAVTMPGQAPADEAPAALPTVGAAPVVKAEGQVGGVQLAWSDLGPGVSYRVTRSVAGAAPEVIAEGLPGHSLRDASAPVGRPAEYRVAGRGAAEGPLSAPVRAQAAQAAPARPDEAALSLVLPGQPVQTAVLRTADRGRPLRGVLILLGGDPQNLPHLVQAAAEAQWATLTFGEFHFGPPDQPRPLTTKVDPYHAVLVLDLRRPALGSEYLALALQEAARVWPDHPELAAVPLAGWAFSQAGVSLVQVLSRPEWAPRLAALVHADVLEVDATAPLLRIAGVPQLFLLSGRDDPYSQLRQPMAYVPAVTREDYLRRLVGPLGVPATVVSLTGEGHGGGQDSPYAALWLQEVLAQVDGPPASLRYRRGWTGTFQTELTAETPWGDGRKVGVRLTGASVEPASAVRAPASWFPSRRSAEEWLKLFVN